MQKQIPQHAGFSLVELLVVIALIVVLATLAVTSFGQYRQQLALTTTVQTIATHIVTVHNRALSGKGGEPHSIRITADGYDIFPGTTYSASDPELERFGIDERLLLSSTLPGDGTLTFARLSGAPQTTATITVAISDDVTQYAQLYIGERGEVSILNE